MFENMVPNRLAEISNTDLNTSIDVFAYNESIDKPIVETLQPKPNSAPRDSIWAKIVSTFQLLLSIIILLTIGYFTWPWLVIAGGVFVGGMIAFFKGLAVLMIFSTSLVLIKIICTSPVESINKVIVIVTLAVSMLLQLIVVAVVGVFATIVSAFVSCIGGVAMLIGGKEYAQRQGFFYKNFWSDVFAVFALPWRVVKFWTTAATPEAYNKSAALYKNHIGAIISMICFVTVALLLIFPPVWLLPVVTALVINLGAVVIYVPALAIIFTSVAITVHAMLTVSSNGQFEKLPDWISSSMLLVADLLPITIITALLVAFPPATLLPLITSVATYLGIGHLAFSALSLIFAAIVGIGRFGVGLVYKLFTGTTDETHLLSHRVFNITLVVIFASALTAMLVVIAPVGLVPLINATVTLLGIGHLGIGSIALMCSSIVAILTLATALLVDHACHRYVPSLRNANALANAVEKLRCRSSDIPTGLKSKSYQYDTIKLRSFLNNSNSHSPDDRETIYLQILDFSDDCITVSKNTWKNFCKINSESSGEVCEVIELYKPGRIKKLGGDDFGDSSSGDIPKTCYQSILSYNNSNSSLPTREERRKQRAEKKEIADELPTELKSI